MTVGVLALQGDFQEHLDALRRFGAPSRAVRLPEDLDAVDRLIIPGGESTTIGKLLLLYGLMGPIRERAKKGMPLWGTCAGAILMAKRIANNTSGQPSLSLMDITARRNAFGRQLDSFETQLSIPMVSKRPFPVVFIRAPVLEDPGKNVDILASLPDGKIVAAREGNLLATCFHPELSASTAIHEYFLSL